MILRIFLENSEDMFVFNNAEHIPSLKDNLVLNRKKFQVYRRVFNYDESEIHIFARSVI
jgi:hypothetical protein